MADDLLTAGKIAKEIGVSDARVKKTIKELGLEPDAKKGVKVAFHPLGLHHPEFAYFYFTSSTPCSTVLPVL